ncbi:lipocalin family protein [Prevotellaceae bacterium LKV-178-WT-2A]|uniref:Lipocalin family protein n=2 Tax=Hallella mizrahii TaxID=2606637 RepID=A0A7K0KBY1_9BACT|nr:lipocalin family protein [Hallella mizrahii]
MRAKTLITVTLAAGLFGACTSDNATKDNTNIQLESELKITGDKTIYGLACEGCNDSTILLLPNDGSDPVKYDIIDATRNHKIRGKIKTGDWICLITNKNDKRVADFVMDLDQLRGIWCYIVMPKMRDYNKMSKRLQARMMENMSDSLKETFLIPREYGFWLKRQWQAQSVGYVKESSTLAEESPVVYPQLGYYVAWGIWNGKIIIARGTPKFSDTGQVSVTNMVNDTCDVDYLDADSLVLSSDGQSRSYYRKSDINDVNKRANAIAAMRSKQALQQATESK